jgi:hypothetical protein
LPVWVWAVVAGAVGAAVLPILALSVLLARGPSSSPSTPSPSPSTSRPRYPVTGTKINGWTAPELGEKVKDVGECEEWALALREFKAEGVPYLIAAAEYHASNPTSNETNVAECLWWLDGSYVDPADLPRIVAFLDSKYAKTDAAAGTAFIVSVRFAALCVLRRAGPKAKPYASEVRKLLDNPHLKEYARDALAAMGE